MRSLDRLMILVVNSANFGCKNLGFSLEFDVGPIGWLEFVFESRLCIGLYGENVPHNGCEEY